MDAKVTPTTIEEYIAAYPADVQERLRAMHQAVRSVAPDAAEKIGYGIPTFTLNGKNLVHFGASKKHIGFYPTPSGIENFAEDFSRYEGAKGSVQFPLDQPLPLDLVKRVTAWRVEQLTAAKKKTK